MKRSTAKTIAPKIPSLNTLAKTENPFDDTALLLKRLFAETAESRHLEWKLTPPFGIGVTNRAKCRMVKALISFANTDGGFIVFGIDPQGKWLGFSESDLKATDPAMIAELVNGCINPEIPCVNYGILKKTHVCIRCSTFHPVSLCLM